MKLVVIFSLLAGASAFTAVPFGMRTPTTLHADGSTKINNLVDLDSPKVGNNMMEGGMTHPLC